MTTKFPLFGRVVVGLGWFSYLFPSERRRLVVVHLNWPHLHIRVRGLWVVFWFGRRWVERLKWKERQ